MNIDSQTKLLGIIGYPIKHSLSPILHTTLAKNYGLNFVYLAFEVPPQKFKYIRECILTLNIRGLNVTIPYKEKIMHYLDEIDEKAKEVGAVNTIVNRNNKLFGYNTDIYGFEKSLEGVSLKGEDVLVLGCGGVSKAIVCGLKDFSIREIFVYDIDENKMSHMKKKFGKIVNCIKSSQIKDVLEKVKLVVNATPLGMKEGDLLPVEINWIKKEHIVYDVIYNRETELVSYAKKLGCKVIDGKSMFVYQAEQSFFLWTGVRPDTKIMFEIIGYK
jgi:shikimate dehydrogenase